MLDLKYKFMYKNLHVGNLTENRIPFDGGSGNIHFLSKFNYEPLGHENINYPAGMYTYTMGNSAFLQPVIEGSPGHYAVTRWLANRIFPKEREGSAEILEALDLPFYDVIRICKKTRCVTMEDYYWVAFDPEDKYEKIHPRHLAETGQSQEIEKLKLSGNLV